MKHLFNLKSYLKFLSHNQLYTFIEILGLSIAFTFVVIITIYSIQEFSKDNFHEKGERIYALANEDNFGFSYQIGERLQERYPEIEKVCALNNHFWGKAVTFADKQITANLLLADSTFFDLFSFDLLSGNRENALQRKNDAIISETFANKLFPDSDPLGQTLELDNGLHVMVNGVMSDVKNSAIRYCDILLRIDNMEYLHPEIQSADYQNTSAVIFLLLQEGTTLFSKQTEIAGYFRETYLPYQQERYSTVSFIPVKDLYFSMLHKGGFLEEGEKLYVQMVMMIGCLILIFAVINYINLTVAQNGFRAREMATRQLLGSSRIELFFRLILESFALTLVAFSVAVFLSYLCAPYAGRLLETTIYISDYLTPGIFLGILLFVLLISILVGWLPALLLSRAKAVDVVKGKYRQQTKMVFSKFFITFQHLITCTLVGCAIIVIWQTHYMIHAPLGYNTKDIINLEVAALDKEKAATLANELRQLGGVNRIAFSEGIPFNSWNGFRATYEGTNIYFPYLVVDTTFMDLFGIQIVQENNLSHADGFYFSEYAVKMLGLDPGQPVVVTDEKTMPVAGIVKNIQLHNATNSLFPVLIQIKKAEEFPNGIRNFSIETKGDPLVAFQEIKKKYEAITRLEFSGDFIDSQIEQSFFFYKQMSSLITLFAIVAAVLSLLGLLAMSTYFIQQRIREIAVRKVFGSTNSEILQRLLYAFLSYVLIAFVLAAPLIWSIGDFWLSGHRYRISVNPAIFVLTALFCCTIALFTVVWQSYTAANLNPADTIKSE